MNVDNIEMTWQAAREFSLDHLDIAAGLIDSDDFVELFCQITN